MNSILSLIISILLILSTSFNVSAINTNSDELKNLYVENEILVKFKESTNIHNEIEALQKIKSYKLKYKLIDLKQLITSTKDDSLGLTRIYKLTFFNKINMEQIVRLLMQSGDLEYAEPNYLLQLSASPNDPYFSMQWYLNNVGQCYDYPICSPRTSDADIDAIEAWDLETSSNIVIAVIDSGLKLNHPDLQGNIWENLLEVNGQPGIDDDFNGLVDDFYGWNYKDNNNQLQDNFNHGTPIAGIYAERTNNLLGASGICSNCKIMTLKVTDTNLFPLTFVVSSINYAINKNAKIISMSFATPSPSETFRTAILNAHNAGIIMVASANNDNSSILRYPAAYPEVIGVAGTTAQDLKWTSSNYGTWVDISAPSLDIFSIDRLGSYGFNDGTSYAAPIVGGVAALLLSKDPSLTKAQVEQIILNSCDDIYPLNPLYIGMLGCGRVNAYRALIGIPGTLLDVEAHDGYVSGQSDLTPGGRVIIGLKVTNNLDIPLYEVSVKLDTDSPDPDREFEIYRLGPGETTNVNLHWSYQNAGTYHPFVIVDNNNIFTETDENNNRIDLNVVIAEPLKPNQNEVAT